MPGQSRSGSVTPAHPTNEDSRRNFVLKAHGSASMPDRILPRNEGLAVLPRRRQADNFVLCYWEFIHPLFPVLHKPSFTHSYDKLWSDDSDAHVIQDTEAEEAIFTSILNLVFALGCKFSSLVDPEQKTIIADDFYQRSRQSYPFDILDSTSISLVQMLVLTGVYLQSTQHASRCWNSVGLAIRMAQSLGLHVDHGDRKSMSLFQLEMRRRLWHTCVHLDRLLSMTFGRPSMIGHSTDVPIPDLIDDEYLGDRDTTLQPGGIPSRLGLFVSSCKLFELLEEILGLFYRDSSGVSSQRQANGATRASQLVTPTLDLNRRLDGFAESVPEYLRVMSSSAISSSNEDHIHLQKQVLYCRFLYVRLLSLRPLLLLATRRESSPTSSLDDEVIRSCCNLCIATACRLINTLHDNLGTLYRSSGWHTVYFTFAGAVVLLASSKLDEDHTRINLSQVEASWSRCLSILEYYENQIHSAKHAIRILKAMKSQVSHPPGGQVHSHVAPVQMNQPPNQDLESNEQALPVDLYGPIDLDDPNLFSTDNISEAWFGQQLVNLDWLELPQM